MRQKDTRMGGRCKSEGLWLVSSMIGCNCLSWINWSFWHFAWILNGCYFAQGCFIVFGFRMAGWLRFQRVGFKIHWWGCLGRNQFIRSNNLMNMNRLSENVSETPALEKKVLVCLEECWFMSFQPCCDFVIHELWKGAATLLAVSLLPRSCCGSWCVGQGGLYACCKACGHGTRRMGEFGAKEGGS